MSEKTRKSFGSDNHSGTHPAVMRAIIEANAGVAPAYGADPWTKRATGELKQLFGSQGEAYLLHNGSAANVFGLGLLLARHEAVVCSSAAHINTDECGSPEHILGTKLLAVPTPDGKLTPELIESRLTDPAEPHFPQAGVVSVTQSTECGTCYSLEELAKIRDFCRSKGLRVYMDGARLANAAAHLGCALAELAAYADVVSFGGTKNGAMGVEAVIVMRPEYTAGASYLRMQHMQLASKMRFLAAQFIALLEDDLWLRNARQANAMASRLATGAAALPGIELVYPVEADAVFARLDPRHVERLRRDWTFHVWDAPNSVVRWMTAFDVLDNDVDTFLDALASVTAPDS